MPEIQAPTLNYISQGLHGNFNAVDYSSYADRSQKTQNKNIHAFEDGTITSYGVSGACGNRLVLTSKDGLRRWGMCHLERNVVPVGSVVKRGTLIGIMGYTGLTDPDDVPEGTHLHAVCFTGGKYVYPPDLYNAAFKSDPKGEDILDKETVLWLYIVATNNYPSQGNYDYWVGRPAKELASAFYNSKVNENMRWRADNKDGGYPFLFDENKKLKKQLGDINQLESGKIYRA